MRVKVIGSGSSGNCYILEAADECLVIEAGVPVRRIRAALPEGKRTSGCLVTHRHNDHAGHVSGVAAMGVRVLAPRDVIASKAGDRVRMFREAEPGRGYVLGGFRAVAFEASHDVPCLGYFVHHAECGWVLFATDSYALPPVMRQLSHIMIECNYSDEALERAIVEGRTAASQRPRLLVSHMSLGACLAYLRLPQTRRVTDITLLHLSAENSDARAFAAAVEGATGKITRVAEAGMEYDI